MKRIFLPALALLAAAVPAVGAAEFPWLTFRLTDGTELAVASENLSINYAAGALQLTSATVNSTLEVDKIRSMQFTSDPSSIVAVESADAPAEYFTINGMKAGVFTSIDDARAALPAGVYVARVGNKSVKVIF